ncbi:MAG: hypothetical protein JW809_01200 [Pirellulales bacterium]|nr:hypothetical protein [Pirellulales bacterium]
MSGHIHMKALLLLSGVLLGLPVSAGCQGVCSKRQFCPYDLMPPCFSTRVASEICSPDPCFGLRPTCWQAWSPCCPPCPPPWAACPNDEAPTGSSLDIRPIPEEGGEIEELEADEPLAPPAPETAAPVPPPPPAPPETTLSPEPRAVPRSAAPDAEKPSANDGSDSRSSPLSNRLASRAATPTKTTVRFVSAAEQVAHVEPVEPPSEEIIVESRESAKVRVLSKPPLRR